VSLLSAVGLPELIAQSPQEYVSIAVGLAADLPRLTQLRRTLRARMTASPLMDGPRFARDIEAAYRRMWQTWCKDGAIDALRQAVARRPDSAEAHSRLGIALIEQGQIDAALAAFRQAIAVKPQYAESHSNLGNALREAGELDAAIAAYRQAILLDPASAEAHSNLGNALKDIGQVDEAIHAFRRAIALQPDFTPAHYNLALALLYSDLPEGWREYEWRWKFQGSQSPHSGSSGPLWDGGDLKNRTILVHHEQGLGDTIHFARYIPMLAERGAKVIFECQSELKSLLQNLSGAAQVIAAGEKPPEFDCHVPLLSLPLHFQTTLKNIPAAVPYLRPDGHRVEAWRRRFAGAAGLKVGLVWAGSPLHRSDRQRSMAPELLSPLPAVKGVTFFSLQKPPGPRMPPGIVNLSDDLHDFCDTAAALSQLDLLISVDTAAAHLAGALGRPVWVMLQFMPDWRWLLHRDDTPWYPTMRLFRQRNRGDWAEVIGRVAAALAALAPGAI
jgi:predicted TPR repeat methyltransferase